ncbi:hypothetical protein CSPX01_01990, partial [Colletotrichum filicis]
WPYDQYYWNNRAFVGSLVLHEGENLTYPENTFRDLAFPSIGDLPPSVAKVADGTPVELSLPAATLVARCERQAFNIRNTTDGDVCAMQAFHNRSVLDSAPSVSNVYLWRVSDYSTTDPESLQAWQCRYSWERIMVSVEMVSANGKLVLDNTNPPRPDRSASTPWKHHIPVPFLDPQTDGLEAESCGSAFPEVTRTPGLVS